jgi:hypothetical protein
MNIFKEIRIVWKIFSLLILFFLIALFSINNNTLYSLSPKCTSVSLYNEQCILCGTTRAFIEIKKFNFNNAYLLNRSSIFLYFMLIFNTLFFINSLKKKFYENS